jgi:hypothetical protein
MRSLVDVWEGLKIRVSQNEFSLQSGQQQGRIKAQAVIGLTLSRTHSLVFQIT